jgi:hypothetical protein
MTINLEYTKYSHFKYLYIDSIITKPNNHCCEYGTDIYSNRDPTKLFRLVRHYDGNFGYATGYDSLKIMHIDKNNLLTFIECLKNKIDANIMLIIDAMLPCSGGSDKQYAVSQWIYENDYLYFTDYEDGHSEFCRVSVKLNDSIIENIQKIYDYHDDNIENAFEIMTYNIEKFNNEMVEKRLMTEERIQYNIDHNIPNKLTGLVQMMSYGLQDKF